MFAADFSDATVLALFLLPDNLAKLRDKFLALKPGTRIVANTFWIEGWTPDEQGRTAGHRVFGLVHRDALRRSRPNRGNLAPGTAGS